LASAKQRAWRAKFARLYGGGRKKASRAVTRITRRVRREKRGGLRMAKRGHRRSSGGFGGLGKSGGMLPPMLKSGVAGWGAASIGEMFGIGGVLGGLGLGFIAGGMYGAAGGVAKPLLKGVDFKGVGSQVVGNAIG
jgi:hypothetical protein